MSLDDGLVMQIHPGSMRNHNPARPRALRPRHGRRHPDPHRLRARAQAAARPLRQRARPDASSCSRSTRPPIRASSRRSPATIRCCGSGPPGGSTTRPKACGASASSPPRRPASTTRSASTTTRARSARSRRATTWRAASTARYLAELVVKHLLDEDEAREVARDLAYGSGEEGLQALAGDASRRNGEETTEGESNEQT